MNKNLKSLAEDAGMSMCSLGYGIPENVLWGERNIERFAELIVQECMAVAKEYQSRGGNCYVDDKIAEHFGVKK